MAIEMAVLDQRPSVLCHRSGEHVGEDARHRRRSQHIVEPTHSSFDEQFVHVMKKIIDVLHREFEVGKAELIGKLSLLVEFRVIDDLVAEGHGEKPGCFETSRRIALLSLGILRASSRLCLSPVSGSKEAVAQPVISQCKLVSGPARCSSAWSSWIIVSASSFLSRRFSSSSDSTVEVLPDCGSRP